MKYSIGITDLIILYTKYHLIKLYMLVAIYTKVVPIPVGMLPIMPKMLT